MRPSRLACRAVLPGALLLAAGLGGCGEDAANKFAPACPQLALLKDASDLTRFAGATQDPATLVLAARIVSVPAACADGGPGRVKAALHVVISVARGPAAAGDTATVPYFVALLDGDKLLNEQDFAIKVQFPPNADQTRARDADITLSVPVTKTKTAAAYHIYVGFRLTPAELAYNRKLAGE